MKTIITFTIGILFSFSLLSQNSIEEQKQQLENLIVESFDGIWSELNSENILKYYTEDFLLLEHGEVWNNDSIANYTDRAVMNKPLPTRINKIEIIEIKIEGKRAWLAYHNEAFFKIDEEIVREAYWLESANAVLTEDGWKLEMLHSTRGTRD